MLKIFKIIIAGVVFALLVAFAIFFYLLKNIDFVGNKDPKTMEENVRREKAKLLFAEFKTDTMFSKITLLDKDSIQIDCSVRGWGHDKMIFEKYHLSGDTIIMEIEIAKRKLFYPGLETIINTDKLLISGNKLLYSVDKDNKYINSKFMEIEYNSLSKSKNK